jgi:hypothetical protein
MIQSRRYAVLKSERGGAAMLRLSRGLFIVGCLLLAGFLVLAFLSGVLAIHVSP